MDWLDHDLYLEISDGRPVRQEVERVAQQHSFKTRDGVHSDLIGDNLSLVSDDCSVRHRQTIEKIHQHHN